MTKRLLLQLSCVDRPGIVAAVAAALAGEGGNIEEAHQFNDAETGKFFTRIVFAAPGADALPRLHAAMAPVAAAHAMAWSLRDVAERRRVLLLASRFDHCLVDLLYRVRIDELHMTVAGIVSNHGREAYAGVDFGGVPFHHLPVTAATKPAQEAALRQVIEGSGAELIVLARYMQILSDEMAAFLAGRCINIHHSFLPGFKGARPYHQAHARGVKLIGATAHYVTGDLDEGPIIEQDVERITHQDSPDDLIRKGRDIERRVLARAVAWHLDGRVFVNRNKTVVFGR